MEDFLYILIGVAWLVYSVYKSQNKKTANRQAASKKDEDLRDESLEPASEESYGQARNSSYNSMIEELLGRVTEPAYAPAQPVAEVQEPTFSQSWKTRTDLLKEQRELAKPKYESIEFIDTSPVRLEEDIGHNYTDELYEGFDSFDLRTAVIYSEILKRPEY